LLHPLGAFLIMPPPRRSADSPSHVRSMFRTIRKVSVAGLSEFTAGLKTLKADLLRRTREMFGPVLSAGLRAILSRVSGVAGTSILEVVRSAISSAQSYATLIGLARAVTASAPGAVDMISMAATRNAALGRVLTRIETRVRRALMTAGSTATVAEAADVAMRAASSHAWEVERVLRTEASFAYNRARVNTIAAMASRDPRVMMRWTEMVDDRTGRPLDDRVAPDSIALHGQIAPPGQPFTMPAVSGLKTAGQTYLHPPNRPNDRAVLVPWVPGSGVPAWRMLNGMRVDYN